MCQTSMLSAHKFLVKAVLGHEPGKMISGGTWKGMKLKPGFGSCSMIGPMDMVYLSWVAVPHVFHYAHPSPWPRSAALFWQSQTNTKGSTLTCEKSRINYPDGKLVPQIWCQRETSYQVYLWEQLECHKAEAGDLLAGELWRYWVMIKSTHSPVVAPGQQGGDHSEVSKQKGEEGS